jgi:type IV pilus assembly protein PilE
MRARGWTLIEVLIVMVIVAILAALAIFSYSQYTVRSQRSVAQQLLQAIRDRQQQYMLDSRSFSDTIGPGGLNFGSSGWDCTTNCVNDYYVVNVEPDNDATPPNFVITATPTNARQIRDGVLTLDNAGAKERLLNGQNVGW